MQTRASAHYLNNNKGTVSIRMLQGGKGADFFFFFFFVDKKDWGINCELSVIVYWDSL